MSDLFDMRNLKRESVNVNDLKKGMIVGFYGAFMEVLTDGHHVQHPNNKGDEYDCHFADAKFLRAQDGNDTTIDWLVRTYNGFQGNKLASQCVYPELTAEVVMEK